MTKDEVDKLYHDAFSQSVTGPLDGLDWAYICGLWDRITNKSKADAYDNEPYQLAYRMGWEDGHD
jgi:hypothetical protein